VRITENQTAIAEQVVFAAQDPVSTSGGIGSGSAECSTNPVDNARAIGGRDNERRRTSRDMIGQARMCIVPAARAQGVADGVKRRLRGERVQERSAIPGRRAQRAPSTLQQRTADRTAAP
jgi:hypothetical protein